MCEPKIDSHVGRVQVFSFIEEEWTRVGQNDMIMTGSNFHDELGLTDLAISTFGSTIYYCYCRITKWGLCQSVHFGGRYCRWSLLGQVINGERFEQFGVTVDLSNNGRRLAIGGNNNSNQDEGLIVRGRVAVYDYDDSISTWVMVGEPLYVVKTQDHFGNSVSISDDGGRLAVGRAWGVNANGDRTGHVRVFDFDEGSNQWIKIGEDNGESKWDYSGMSVALSDNAHFLAVGAPERNGGNWNGYKDIGSACVYEMAVCEQYS